MDNQFIRLNMKIIGTVQRVGYRHIVQDIARRYHVTGNVQNLIGYDVQVVAEGLYDNVIRFKNAIKIQEQPVFVDGIESTEEEYTGEFQYFEVIRGSSDEELAERFDTAIGILSRMEKKQDIAIDIHKESIGLQKETLGLQKETLEEIKGTRSDLDRIFSKDIAEMREEIREIRSALIQIGVLHSAKS